MNLSPTTFDMARIERALVEISRKLDAKFSEIIDILDGMLERFDEYTEDYDEDY
jgi:hypothetical protein